MSSGFVRYSPGHVITFNLSVLDRNIRWDICTPVLERHDGGKRVRSDVSGMGELQLLGDLVDRNCRHQAMTGQAFYECRGVCVYLCHLLERRGIK